MALGISERTLPLLWDADESTKVLVKSFRGDPLSGALKTVEDRFETMTNNTIEEETAYFGSYESFRKCT